MIVDQVHIRCVLPFKTKNNAPIAGDRDGPLTLMPAFKRMKPKTRNIHAGWTRGRVQGRQDHLKLTNLLRIDAARVAPGEEPLQSLVAKAQDDV
jgi:hypothetical protein